MGSGLDNIVTLMSLKSRVGVLCLYFKAELLQKSNPFLFPSSFLFLQDDEADHPQ